MEAESFGLVHEVDVERHAGAGIAEDETEFHGPSFLLNETGTAAVYTAIIAAAIGAGRRTAGRLWR